VTAIDALVGSGKEAKVDSKVTVNYIGACGRVYRCRFLISPCPTGKLQNGKVFDQTREKPFRFTLGSQEVIAGCVRVCRSASCS
jgi:FKBP-type peptidyl-prolyl cis-trans isomerase